MMLTMMPSGGYSGRIPAIVGCEFGNSNDQGGRKPASSGAAFFVSATQLVGRMLRGLVPAGFLDHRFSNSAFGSPFLFGNENSEYATDQGRTTMAIKQQAESATTTSLSQAQATYSLLQCCDKLDELRCRLSFIMDGVTQSSDWINDQAAEGLYFTVKSIWDEIDEVRESVSIEMKRKAASCG